MIDWFASKIGMLIFVTVVLSALLGFVAMETGSFALEQKARMAEDVARLIDASSSGETITYQTPIENYNLIINSNEKSISVDGISRQFLANAANSTVSDSPSLTIHNANGVVYVKT